MRQYIRSYLAISSSSTSSGELLFRVCAIKERKVQTALNEIGVSCWKTKNPIDIPFPLMYLDILIAALNQHKTSASFPLWISMKSENDEVARRFFYSYNYYNTYYSEQKIPHVTLQTLKRRYHGEQYMLTTPKPIQKEDMKEKIYKTEQKQLLGIR